MFLTHIFKQKNTLAQDEYLQQQLVTSWEYSFYKVMKNILKHVYVSQQSQEGSGAKSKEGSEGSLFTFQIKNNRLTSMLTCYHKFMLLYIKYSSIQQMKIYKSSTSIRKYIEQIEITQDSLKNIIQKIYHVLEWNDIPAHLQVEKKKKKKKKKKKLRKKKN